MEFVRESGLWKNSYFLSNMSCFFHRYADTGFKNKWTGLWHRETKFLEFFAARNRGEWLSEDTCRSARYDGVSATHSFMTKSGPVNQRLFIPESNHLLVEFSSRRPMELELDVAVNIRRRYENRTTRQYSTRSTEDSVTCWNELGSLSLKRLSGPLLFEHRPEIREHWPVGEPQNYFVPGRISASGKRVTLLFTPLVNGERHSGPGNPALALRKAESRASSLKGLIITDNHRLRKGFLWSCLATEFCRKKGPGLVSWYAGLPWFQHFWARDIFWVVPSLNVLGHFDDVRKTLEFFARGAENGRIPNLVSETEGRHMNALDPTPLWIISLRDYVANSGDVRFLRKMRKTLEESCRYILSCDRDGDGYVEHDSEFPETWMDTLKRDSRAVDVQALCSSALSSGSEMLSLLPGNRKSLLKDIRDRASFLAGNLESDFFHNGFFIDRFFWKQAVPVRTANALVPILCGFRRHAGEVLDAVESEAFTSGRGIRTRSSDESDFDPGGYHTGATWSLTTSWASAAEFLAGRPERGWKYLSMLLDDIERDALGCIGECWNSKSLELSGCSLQLWGSGFVPRLVDEFMLGIRVNSPERTISVSPLLPSGVSRIERLRSTGHGPVRLRFRKKGKTFQASCSGSRFRLITGEPER